MAKKATKKQQTTRDTSFNFSKDETSNLISVIGSYTANKNFKNIELVDMTQGISVKGQQIINHAAANRTMQDLGEDKTIDTTSITGTYNYRIYGAPFQVTLNNKQNFNNCGVESTLNTLAMAGIIKMKDNLSDQKSVEKKFLKNVWTAGLVDDDGVTGKLDEDDGGTLPDDYKDILRLYNIDSTSYFITRKCDGTEFSNLNELGYKISQGYGAIVGVCSNRLWQEAGSESGKLAIDHAIAITGVVYADNVEPSDDNAPVGFYIHDSGAWMSRYISLEEFKKATLYYEHGMKEADKGDYTNYDEEATYATANYVDELRRYDSELRQFTGKQPNGIFVTITNEPIKTDMFNFNATGDKQNNTIWGNNSDNIIKGMAGNDTLYGKAGDDEIRGGKGNDVIVGNYLTDYDKDFLSQDKFGFKLDNVDYVEYDKNVDYVEYEKTIGIEGRNKLYGDDGNDTIIGGDDIDIIYGGAGNDHIYSGDGRNAVYAGKGNDTIVGGWDNDRLFGEAGNDKIYGFGDDDTIHAGAGDDHIWAGLGDDKIETGKGTDTIYFEGTQHGADTVTSEGGKTIFKFVDEEYINEGKTEIVSKAATISDMNIILGSREDVTSKYESLQIKYYSNDKVATDSVTFDSFYNTKTKKAKALEIYDGKGDKYDVSVLKAKNIKLGKDTGNILFTTYNKGTTITTGDKNDVVTMTDTDAMDFNYLSKDVFDTIHYTGGEDRYVSEERNTHYYVDSFTDKTSLAILDNITPVKKMKIDEKTGLPAFDEELNPLTNEVVSTDDRLYISADKSQFNFLFDVALDNSKALTTQYDGLCVLNNTDDFATVAQATVNNNDVTTEGGIISMGSFFGYNTNKETEEITGIEIKKDSKFYGNGQIEHLYYKQGDSNVEYALENTITAIATSVANWLASDMNATGKTSAFEVFNSVTDENVISSLVQAYTNPLA